MTQFCTLLLTVAFLGGFTLNEVHGLTIAKLSDRLRKLSTLESGVAVQRRELSCTFPSDYPQSCFDSLDQVTATSSGTGSFAVVGITLTLRAALDGVCAPECLDPAVDFYRCLGEEDLAQAYESALCGQHQGLYCFELYINGVADSIIPINTIDTNCSDYNISIEYLGCCSASLFRNPEVSSSFWPFTSFSFTNCYNDVDAAVGSRCLPNALQATATETNAGSESGIRAITKWTLLIVSIAVAYLSSAY